jgi:hypothetical protein
MTRRWRWILLLVAALVGACTDGASPRTACRQVDTCLNDTMAHCVVPASHSCRDTASEQAGRSAMRCPGGTSCQADVPANACSPSTTADIAGARCRPMHARTWDAHALERGFQVPRLPLSIDEAEPGVVSVAWTPPEGGAIVACALFSCEPSFEIAGQSLDGQESTVRMANFDLCATGQRAVRASQGSLLIPTDLERVIAADICELASDAELRRAMPVNALLGCWAYDDTRVIAASQLYQWLALAPTLAQECKPGTHGRPCFDASHGEFGTCAEEQCLPRCVTAHDCESESLARGVPDSELDGGVDEDASPAGDAGPPTDAGPQPCRWECRPVVPGDPLGVCVHL